MPAAVCRWGMCPSGFSRDQGLPSAGFYPMVTVGGWVSSCAISPLVVFPPCGVWLGLCVGRVDPADDLASTGFHDCHQRTVRQPRPTRPRLATGARPSVPHHHPIRPRRARTTSRPTSVTLVPPAPKVPTRNRRRDANQRVARAFLVKPRRCARSGEPNRYK